MSPTDAIDRLRTRNLNLLVPMQLLLQTRSVSQTAERLHTSPSAVSKLLQSLRQEFDDPLLVRSSNTMFLTERARQLLPALDRVLAQFQLLFESHAFEPRRVERVLTLGANDYVQATLGVALARTLRELAPGVQLVMRPIGKGIPRLLADGALDLCIGTENLESRGLRIQPLAREEIVCVAHRDDRSWTGPLSLATLCGLPHVDVTPSGLGLLPAIFESQAFAVGQKRDVLMTVSSFMALPELLRGLRAVAMVPRRLLALPSFADRVRELELDFAHPTYELRMYWHNINHGDAFSIWLRDRVARLCACA
ncbi:MAG: LysR family transcriptional regulator [Comamonadaceae bacterium]|nr:MAG: LysR family transcriptional regulator [Comamonadaceae bacterium]